MAAPPQEIKILQIEKLVYGGEGLARSYDANSLPGQARGQTIFVPFVLPGERVQARVLQQKKEFARTELEAVLTPSENRIPPLCPYFLDCGGCHYQHADYDAQLAFKTQILRETLERTARVKYAGEISVHGSPPFGYRNRTRMHVRSVPGFQMGYYRYGSHDLLAIEKCPISSPLINRAIAAVWEGGRSGKAPIDIAEIEFFANSSDDRLLLELYLTRQTEQQPLKKFCAEIKERLPELAGASSFGLQPTGRNSLPSAKPELIYGSSAIQYKTAQASYQVSAGSFFQTNRFLVDELVNIVVGERHGDTALDLYAGAGLFALPLSHRFKHVVAVEAAPASSQDLVANAAHNINVVRQTTENYLASAKFKRQEGDLIVVDPPRFGLGEAVTRLLGPLEAKQIVYVSCDPATLARDLKALGEHGWLIQELHLVDLFPQTFHLETVTVLTR